VIHALGPGHGKSLVAAYFLGNNRSVVKAFGIASMIGVVHTFSAFLLTFVIYFVLNTYLSTYFADLESVTIRISAVIIIVIALYLLYKRLPKKVKKQPMWSATQPHQHASSCGCGACQSTSTDLGIILSAGIVPCPGTITIFVFSLSLGAYFVGFLSAVFMSIGMSIVIFAAALLSIKVRKESAGHEGLRKILDYGSLLFIFILGVVLFFLA
jgi:ABC-type nickel/cobalt efflux system permease component RcnA